jgi:hypothetical protein
VEGILTAFLDEGQFAGANAGNFLPIDIKHCDVFPTDREGNRKRQTDVTASSNHTYVKRHQKVPRRRL